MNRSGPSRFARWLLRLQPLGSRRAEVEADLLELFALRARHHGERYARRRFYGDVVSLWRVGGNPRIAKNAKSAGNAKTAKRFWLETMRDVFRDLSFGVRLLRRSPASVLIAIIGLGLAIGVNTSVFSLINIAVPQSGGIADPSSAVRVMRGYKNGMGTSWPYSEYAQLRDLSKDVRLEAAFPMRSSLAASAGSSETVSVQFVTGGYLGALSEGSSLGRFLTPADNQPGAPPVAVASHGYWSRRLGEDPLVIGRTLRFNGVPLTVVGVAPRNFSGSSDSPPSFWMPIASYHQMVGGSPIDEHAPIAVAVIGRIKPAVHTQVAESRLSALVAGLPRSPADKPDEPLTGVRLIPANGAMNPADTFRVALIIAVIATLLGLILLLACVNVANLLLASGISRQREIAVRLALGASRGRLVRQLVTESVSLGLLGGALGFALSIWLVPVLAVLTQFPLNFEISPDLRVYLFLTTMSGIAGVGAGLMPARHAVRHSLAAPLKSSVGVSDTGGRPHRMRSVLIGAQAAASIALLILAALATRGMVRAMAIDVGFDASRLLVLSPTFPRGAYDRAGAKAYWDLAVEKVTALPGVRSVSLASHPPFGNGNRVTIFRRTRYTIYHYETRADYFATLGLAIRRGRAYTEAEAASGAPVVVISEALARDYFGAEDPIGQPLARIVEGSKQVIIGVAANAITASLRELSAAATYEPMADTTSAHMVVRTDGAADGLARPMRTAVESLDPRVRLEVRAVADGLERQLREPRIVASLAGVLAALALGLALVGIYGVTSFVIGQRTQEVSIRMALGASSRDVLALLLSDSLRPVVVGLGLGILLTFLASNVFATRPFAGILYGGSSADPVAFGAAAIVLLAAALAAVIVPARRAAAIEPAAALREM